jgi:hypothetical protein
VHRPPIVVPRAFEKHLVRRRTDDGSTEGEIPVGGVTRIAVTKRPPTIRFIELGRREMTGIVIGSALPVEGTSEAFGVLVSERLGQVF